MEDVVTVGAKSWLWTGLFFIEAGVISPRRNFVVKTGVDNTVAITLLAERKLVVTV